MPVLVVLVALLEVVLGLAVLVLPYASPSALEFIGLLGFSVLTFGWPELIEFLQ
jgi:hypothetical protein